MYSVSSDPRGLILADHYAGFEFRHEFPDKHAKFWFADASDSKPGSTKSVSDQYWGFLFTKDYSNVNGSHSLFLVGRNTRETFLDKNLVTQYANGKSDYYWLGLNGKVNSLHDLNIESNLIGAYSRFTANSGQSDDNTSWLAHFSISKNFAETYTLGLEGLATSGANDSRSGGVQVLGKRRNFPSPNPSSSYLLTVATNDGGDDAVGSVRQPTAVIAKTDLDEGLGIAILSLNKVFNDKWSALIKYGLLQSNEKNLTTNSNDFGAEGDLKITFKSTANITWIFDHGHFQPGSFFNKKEAACLTSLRYRLDF